MSTFSKQYCDKNDPDFPWDFDIDQVSKTIPEGCFQYWICEGTGFTAIGRRDGIIWLGYPDQDNEFLNWEKYLK